VLEQEKTWQRKDIDGKTLDMQMYKNRAIQEQEDEREERSKQKGYHLTYSEVTLVFFWVVLPEKALLSPEHERRVTNSTKQAREETT
jgi:hypothetical protein